MNTCATCKHWHEHDNDVNDAMARLGEPREGTCLAISGCLDNRACLEWFGAIGSTVVCMTRSDFGCVMHEPQS